VTINYCYHNHQLFLPSPPLACRGLIAGYQQVEGDDRTDKNLLLNKQDQKFESTRKKLQQDKTFTTTFTVVGIFWI
jgi:hypothetical protein